MSASTKSPSMQNEGNVLRSAFNDVDKTVSTNGFLVGKVGHKITVTIVTTSVSNDTEIVSFFDNGTLLYTYTIIYTNGTREQMVSAERTA